VGRAADEFQVEHRAGGPAERVLSFAARVERGPDAGGALFSNSHMALSAAVAGQGFALGLAPLVDEDLAAGRLVRPFAGEISSAFGFWFVCRKDRLQEPKIAAFRDWIFEQAGAEAPPAAA